jgi:hypothetical protein
VSDDVGRRNAAAQHFDYHLACEQAAGWTKITKENFGARLAGLVRVYRQGKVT